MKNKKMQALIISGGSLDHKFALSYMDRHFFDCVIAVDRGMNFFHAHHIVPDYIVGDFDSVEEDALRSFQEMSVKGKPAVLQFQPEKDETDTEIAIRTAISKGCASIHLLGATGTRLDHVLGNIHLLGAALALGAECMIADPNNRVRMIREGLVIKKEEQYGHYISLFPFTPQVKGLTLTGFKYPLDHYTLERCHSLGVSNEIVEEEARICFQEGALLVVESRD